ncbi:BaiN/RdsA family NAD(P)/FAD-dependent oxidoreductase [Algicola sagamiensis]|uniref:NAD(P)/FAD-dependent oxidoreductase n=1 Tax=Algicola sagamiensis TaxID=163869 RepID=UPI00037ADB49|nr:NAD(P)/FAD-dependent oxidoreductase [Algicola sagamiensis]
MKKYDVIVIGAGAAGMMCAATAAARGRQVLIIEHGKRPGRKILISGGGRCNFTNMYADPSCYLSQNPHFVKSALSRYTPWDFIALVNEYQIPYHEKTLGQLFCDDSAKAIVEMLVSECQKSGAAFEYQCEVLNINKIDSQFHLETSHGDFSANSVVIASGGLSMPKLGATPFGYQVAEQFGLEVLPTRAALVPLTWHAEDKERYQLLSGVSAYSTASANQTFFKENTLFTHRGLSGPAILQISSFWTPGDPLIINWSPDQDIKDYLEQSLAESPNQQVKTALGKLLPKRFLDELFSQNQFYEQKLNALGSKQYQAFANTIHEWQILPNGTEGYRTAEVTLGGVNTDGISSKTMESKTTDGLYFIGEVLDVTGWLGGYNFQWSWSSGWAAGQVC